MYRKKKKKTWIIILVLIAILAAGAVAYYCQMQAAAADEEEELVLEDGQELMYLQITQILGNEMTATVLQEDGEETTESGTWTIPVGTDVVTKLGTTTTFARLASGDTIKVLVQDGEDDTQDILKIWIVDLTQQTEGRPEMEDAQPATESGDGTMPEMGDMLSGDGAMPDMGEMPSGGGMSENGSAGANGMPGGGN